MGAGAAIGKKSRGRLHRLRPGCGWQTRDRETLPSRTAEMKTGVRHPAYMVQQRSREVVPKLCEELPWLRRVMPMDALFTTKPERRDILPGSADLAWPQETAPICGDLGSQGGPARPPDRARAGVRSRHHGLGLLIGDDADQPAQGLAAPRESRTD